MGSWRPNASIYWLWLPPLHKKSWMRPCEYNVIVQLLLRNYCTIRKVKQQFIVTPHENTPAFKHLPHRSFHSPFGPKLSHYVMSLTSWCHTVMSCDIKTSYCDVTCHHTKKWKMLGVTPTAQKRRSPLWTMVHNAGRWCTMQVDGAQYSSVPLKWCTV